MLTHVHRLGIPLRLDHRPLHEVTDHILAFMAHHRVAHALTRIIMHDNEIVVIWMTPPHTMMILMKSYFFSPQDD